MHDRLVRSSIWLAMLLAASSCGGGSTPATPSNNATPTPGAAAADVTITIQGNNGAMSFSPASAAVKAGQTVSWRNADSIDHTATQDSGSFNTNDIRSGSTSAPIKMSTGGSFVYHCSFHPGMVGTLNVQ